MDFAPQFRLERTCMVEVVMQLIQCNIPNKLESFEYDQWEEPAMKDVKGKIQKLELFTPIKEELISMVKPIFKHIWNAIDNFSIHITRTPIRSILKCLQMTPWGTVDMKLSAEALFNLSDEELPKLMRYHLSQTFCLGDPYTFYEEFNDIEWQIIFNLPGKIYVEEQGHSSGYSNFERAVLSGNELAARHFWITEEERVMPKDTIWLLSSFYVDYADCVELYSSTLPGWYLFLFGNSNSQSKYRKRMY